MATRLANVRRVENALGDLDIAFKVDGLEMLLARMTYGRADEADAAPNQSGIDIDGNVRNGLATLKAATKLYRDFCLNHTAVA